MPLTSTLAMYQESSSLSAFVHIFGVSVPGGQSANGLKGGRAAPPRMRRQREKRIAGVVGAQPAVVIAFDEMWTYRQARRQGNR